MAATTTINYSSSSILSSGGGGGVGVVVVVPPASSPLVLYPCPRSPPKYPDMIGKHRELVKVQKLEREIGVLEEELKSVENLQLASRSCKDGNACLNLSWICCCSSGCSLRCTPKNCSLCPQKGKKSCCSGCCKSCSGSCCRPSCCCGDCSCFGKSSCSKSCCALPTCTNCCSCFKCSMANCCSCFRHTESLYCHTFHF